MDLSEEYTFCLEVGITSQMLFGETNFPTVNIVKKGLILELHRIQQSGNIPWRSYCKWVETLFPESAPISPDAFRSSVQSLKSKRLKLRNKDHIKSLLQEPYCPPKRRASSATAVPDKKPLAPSQSVFMQEVVKTVNKSLATEVVNLNKKCMQQQNEIAKKTKELQSMQCRLKKYNPHNIQRRLHRRDTKISDQNKVITTLNGELKKKKATALKNVQDRVRYYKRKLKDKTTNGCEHCEELEREIIELEKEVNQSRSQKQDILEANAQLIDDLKELKSKKITTCHDGKYSDDVRLCVMELLSHNVGVLKIEPVIRAVLKLADVECDQIPKHTTICDMLVESRSLAQIQLAETLTSTHHNTLHSDGTSKFGHKYTSYQVSTDDGSMSMGMQQVCSGAAVTTLETLQDILEEVTQTAELHGYSHAGKIILTNIKSTMSDRASAQKSFNRLLSEYRAEVLPSVCQSWDSLTSDEKQAMSQINHFFCGMHLIVNMAEHVSETLKCFENAHPSTSYHNESESGTIRLVQTACKAFQKRACEKSGYPLQFNTYLQGQGILKNPLIHFRGNRFNIIFANGGRVFYLRQHIVNFLTNVWGAPNKLLKAVLSDASCDLYLAGCKTLGLIDKLITGPLWRILETDLHILDIFQYYTKLHKFLKECKDVTTFLTGEDKPFPDSMIKKDSVWVALLTPSHFDPIVEQMVLSCFKSMELLISNVIDDHQPVILEAKKEETLSVPKTNTISERDFARLDRLMREKPNATTLALEAHILFANNKTSEWLAGKTPEERAVMLETARKLTPKHKQNFKQRLASIQQRRMEVQQERIRERLRVEQKLLLQKENLTSQIVQYGLWQTERDIEEKLKLCKTEKQKREALKAQLKFRKTVLQQKYDQEKEVFQFSKRGKQFNSTHLSQNLLKLVHAAATESSTEPTSSSNDIHVDIPPVTLVGKHIDHCFSEGKELVTYSGKVISTVPGFPEWFNIVYDNEPDIVYTFKLLDDWQNGDLKLI